MTTLTESSDTAKASVSEKVVVGRAENSRIANIVDQYSGLLDDLTNNQRLGLIAMLSIGFYDGWRPTRAELVRYLHDEYGVTPATTTGRVAEQMPEKRR